MNTQIIFLITFLTFINFILCFYKNKISFFFKIVDIPKKNKIHQTNVLLFGGVIFFVNLIIFLIYDILFLKMSGLLYSLNVISTKQQIFFFFTIIVTFALGFCDDILNIKPHHKTTIFIIFIYFLLLSSPNYNISLLIFYLTEKKIYFQNFSIYFTLFCFVASLNAFNMFDGINLQSAILYLSFLLIFLFKNINNEFLLTILIPFIFFIYYNIKSLIFLGNSGVYLLAFLFSFIVISDFNKNRNYYVEEIILYMLLPGIDMIRLFLKRILDGKNPFYGDLNHYHHILLNNLGYKKTIFLISFQLFCPIILFNVLKVNLIILILISIILYFFLVSHFAKKISKH